MKKYTSMAMYMLSVVLGFYMTYFFLTEQYFAAIVLILASILTIANGISNDKNLKL